MTWCQDPSVSVEVQILGERATALRYTYVAYVFTASRYNISKLQFYMHKLYVSAEFYSHPYH
jgi:hypothetical protein